MRQQIRILAAIALVAVSLGGASARAAETDEFVRVEVRGTLRTGVVAIGGETTGVTITANGVTWELEIDEDSRLIHRLPAMDKQVVVVIGVLRVERGVEVPQRWIVDVRRIISPADRPEWKSEAIEAASPYRSDGGQLRHALVLKEAERRDFGGLGGIRGRQWTIEPDGRWRQQPFVNRRVHDVEDFGTLSAKQLRFLAQLLENVDLLDLPEEIEDTDIHARIVEIQFGEHRTRLEINVPPGISRTRGNLGPDASTVITLRRIVSKLLADSGIDR